MTNHMQSENAAMRLPATVAEAVLLAMSAIKEDDIEVLRQIVTTPYLANARLPHCPKTDLLVHAVRYRSRKSVEYLLRAGANPDVVFCDCDRIDDYDGVLEGHYMSALMLAINLRDDHLVAVLIDHGASPELPIFVFPNGMRETCADRIQESGSDAMRAAVERWRLLDWWDEDNDWEDGETKRL